MHQDSVQQLRKLRSTMATAKQAVQHPYLFEPDDVWMQQGPMVDELPLHILVNLQLATQSRLKCIEWTPAWWKCSGLSIRQLQAALFHREK